MLSKIFASKKTFIVLSTITFFGGVVFPQYVIRKAKKTAIETTLPAKCFIYREKYMAAKYNESLYYSLEDPIKAQLLPLYENDIALTCHMYYDFLKSRKIGRRYSVGALVPTELESDPLVKSIPTAVPDVKKVRIEQCQVMQLETTHKLRILRNLYLVALLQAYVEKYKDILLDPKIMKGPTFFGMIQERDGKRKFFIPLPGEHMKFPEHYMSDQRLAKLAQPVGKTEKKQPAGESRMKITKVDNKKNGW